MNSHQRRKAARYWQYQYDLGAQDWKKCIVLVAWCTNHFGLHGKDRWHFRYISHYPTEIIFWFHKDADAAWFKLNWL